MIGKMHQTSDNGISSVNYPAIFFEFMGKVLNEIEIIGMFKRQKFETKVLHSPRLCRGLRKAFLIDSK